MSTGGDPQAGDGPGRTWPHTEKARRPARGTALLVGVATALVVFDALLLARVWPWEWATAAPARVISAGVLIAVVVGLDLRPRVTVGPTSLTAGEHTVPTADVLRAAPARRRGDIEEATSGAYLVAATLLARQGVEVELVTAEGLPYRLWIASQDPEHLAEVIEDARAAQRPPDPSPSTSGEPEHRGRRGANPYLAGGFLAVFAGILPWVVMRDVGFEVAGLVTVAVVALVTVPALRPAVVDRDELRSGRVRVAARDIVAARTVPKGHAFPYVTRLPRGNRSVTVWGPSTTVVCVTDPPGETVQERQSATWLIALPRQVDLRQVLPEAVIDRRLPPAGDPRGGTDAATRTAP